MGVAKGAPIMSEIRNSVAGKSTWTLMDRFVVRRE